MEEKKRGGFKRTLLLVVLAAVLGGGTLGGGFGIGVAVMNYMLPKEAETQPVYADETSQVFESEAPTLVPINVEAPNYSDMITNVKDSVVSINVMANMQSYFGTATVPAAGSGFIFSIDDENVYIATNNHVVAETEAITISLNDEDEVDARIIGRDADSDLAVIAVSKEELDATGLPYKAAALGDSSALSMGDPVVAMGNALGEGQTATAGMVSSSGKEIEIEGRTFNAIQTDAAINQGNSGGPLFNINGEVIGINTAKYSSAGVEGMGYSIPMDEAKPILETLRDNGVVDKPNLGISMYPSGVDEQMAEMFNLPSTGVMVQAVVEGSAAEDAGIQAMDIIVEFDGEKIETTEGLKSLVDGKKVGDSVPVSVFRGTERMDLTVIIGNANELTGE